MSSEIQEIQEIQETHVINPLVETPCICPTFLSLKDGNTQTNIEIRSMTNREDTYEQILNESLTNVNEIIENARVKANWSRIFSICNTLITITFSSISCSINSIGTGGDSNRLITAILTGIVGCSQAVSMAFNWDKNNTLMKKQGLQAKILKNELMILKTKNDKNVDKLLKVSNQINQLDCRIQNSSSSSSEDNNV